MAHKIWTFIDHEKATVYSDGIAATEVSVQVCAVITALITTTLKVFVLVKNYLKEPTKSTLCFSEEIRRIIHLCQSLANRGGAIQCKIMKVVPKILPCPWSPLERFHMLPKLFILPLDKQSIVIQMNTGICQGTGTCLPFC